MDFICKCPMGCGCEHAVGFSMYERTPPFQLELFPNENLAPPVRFEKLCLQFCGDACGCGKREFLNSYTGLPVLDPNNIDFGGKCDGS